MKTEDLMFWRELPASSQKSLFRLASLSILAVSAVVWLMLSMSATEALGRAEAARQTQAKVARLVQEAQGLEAKAAALANLAPMAAAQQVSRELSVEKRIASIRPTQVGASQEGVSIFFEGLNLPELTQLLSGLKNRAGLKTVSCSISHRLDVTDLADMQIVLAR